MTNVLYSCPHAVPASWTESALRSTKGEPPISVGEMGELAYDSENATAPRLVEHAVQLLDSAATKLALQPDD
ncbi:MAG: hypothetical protein ACRDZ7_03905 [Acidimicrobiia bacterium]